MNLLLKNVLFEYFYAEIHQLEKNCLNVISEQPAEPKTLLKHAKNLISLLLEKAETFRK